MLEFLTLGVCVLPAPTMPGEVAKTIPVMANFNALLACVNAGGAGCFNDGTEALPSIYFCHDPSTGFWSDSTDPNGIFYISLRGALQGVFYWDGTFDGHGIATSKFQFNNVIGIHHYADSASAAYNGDFLCTNANPTTGYPYPQGQLIINSAANAFDIASNGGTFDNNSGGGPLPCPATRMRFWTSTTSGVDSTIKAIIDEPGNFALQIAGQSFRVKEGSNACMGTATLVAGTKTVSTTAVTANSRIMLTVQSLGTVGVPKAVGVTARTAGTSFTITSADATDTSVVAWIMFEPS